MTEEQKQAIIDNVKQQLPKASNDRLKLLLAIILLEIESYNDCSAVIDWEKLPDIVSELLYHSANSELEATITAVKRGDTSISYANKSNEINQLVAGYKGLIRRLIGCDKGVYFF